MYEKIFNKSADGMLLIEDGRFVDCNQAAVRMLDYKNKDQLLNLHPSQISPEFQPDGRSSFEKAEENSWVVLEKGHRTFEWVHLRSHGQAIWMEVVLTDISYDDKVIFLVVWRNIDEKKRLEKANAYQHMILKSVMNSSSDLIFYKDYSNEKGKYIGCNDAFVQMVGKSKEEIIGHDDIEIFGGKLGAFFRKKDLDVIAQGLEIANEEWVSYPDGRKVLLHTLKSLLKDEDDRTIGIIGISRDITAAYEQKKALEESTLRHKQLANTDPLTGILNRRAIFDTAESLYRGSDKAVLMLDIDNFKQINDKYGHEKGDIVLKHFVMTCSKNLRDEDTFGRLGGEEFVIVLHKTNEAKAKEVASRLIHEIAKQKVSEEKISVTVSIGMAMGSSNHYSSFSEILKDADKTLYKAKASGKNQYQIFSSPSRESRLSNCG